jgi:hypothetical protein
MALVDVAHKVKVSHAYASAVGEPDFDGIAALIKELEAMCACARKNYAMRSTRMYRATTSSFGTPRLLDA